MRCSHTAAPKDPAVAESSTTPELIATLAESVEGLNLAPGSLLGLYDLVEDPRNPRGVRHPIGLLLAIATAAVACGNRSWEAIAQWATEVAPDRMDLTAYRHGIPDESTFRRTLSEVDGQAVDNALGSWIWAHLPERPGLRAVAFDGKATPNPRSGTSANGAGTARPPRCG
ncbi:transposase family protein [Glycomyces buryatensis]|uniref:Transposase family protein n=1 Tax=Glycomyces buryatensis TaxID=2570927 RepID=A0A4S8PUK9_9ACTN|nr:transposase family protein [Glycomyces buryatensis]